MARSGKRRDDGNSPVTPNSSTASYVAAKISGLHGYRSPATPVIIQSPGLATIKPSNVTIPHG